VALCYFYGMVSGLSGSAAMFLEKNFLCNALLKLNTPELLLKQSINSTRKVYLFGNRYKPPTKAEINHLMIILNILGLEPLSSIILLPFWHV
jgi:hypothetical protein